MCVSIPKLLPQTLSLVVALMVLLTFPLIAQEKGSAANSGTPVLWRDPGNVATRDLTYGPGAADLAPAPPFTFVEEDKEGVSPKFKVKDARGVNWNVKLGVESQAETAATRLIWAVGYFAEESYYLPEATIEGLPKLSRGTEFVAGNKVRGARFEPRRTGVTQGENWEWLENPFAGTRELDGLKVLMVLLANYDTTPRNNRIVFASNADTGAAEARYMVTDLGATLGRVGGLGGKRTKNDLEDFSASRFVVDVKDGMVEFDYHTTPKGLGMVGAVFNPGYLKGQGAKEKAMRRIPVENARWIGALLSRLTDNQIKSAFQAAGYNAATAAGYMRTIKTRIGELRVLPVNSE